jgi:hypothetical protein
MGSESGHMQSIKVLQNMVSNTTQLQRKKSKPERDREGNGLALSAGANTVFFAREGGFGYVTVAEPLPGVLGKEIYIYLQLIS